MHTEQCRWLTLACLMLSTAHAADIHEHSATLSVRADENDNRQWLGSVALPLGDSAWAQATAGKTEFAAAGANNMKIIGAALGTSGRTIKTAVEFVQRKGDTRFEQQSWTATLDWRGARGGLGADVYLRSANDESTTTQPGGVFAAPTTTTIRESVEGKGVGLHGDFALTPRVQVFAAAVRYRYDFDVETSTTAGNTPLAFLLGANSAIAGAWRDQAFVDRSYRVGGSYRLQRAVVGAQYFRDHIASRDEALNTVELQAEFPLAEHWSLSPTLGYSEGGHSGSVSYGGMNVRFSW